MNDQPYELVSIYKEIQSRKSYWANVRHQHEQAAMKKPR